MNLSEIQLDEARLIANVQSLKGLTSGETRLLAVVKGNAYGHGLREVVSTLDPYVDGFQVDDLEELREARSLTSKPILVLGYVSKSQVSEALNLGGELAIYDVDRLPLIAAWARSHSRSPVVHLKIDALLGRQGILLDEIPHLVNQLRCCPEVQLGSVYAHFANIEDTTDLGHAFDQMEVFESAWKRLSESGWPDLGRHISATSGLMTVENGNSFVRVGLGLYGLYPSASLGRKPWETPLEPVLRWVSHLAQVKLLPPHHPVGYGLTFITRRETRIGIVPQGYSDGFDRGLSNSGEVLVRGKRCAVLGRVAMNMFAIDLSEVEDASVEDEVVLLGTQGGEQITAEEIASRLGTINYEVTTRISALLPRRLIPSK